MTKQTTNKRDDFPAAVKLELAKRVNFRCSVCDAQTVGPKTGSNKSFTIGKAAHIKAAAPGGPRYDPNQTREERRDIANGIWGCANCADIIDRDEEAYSLEELYRLKDVAEKRARARLGRSPVELAPTPRTRTQIERAIEMFCREEADRLEALDPRFNVSVTWAADGPVHEMHAREPVSPRIVVGGRDRQNVLAQLRDVLEYGGSKAFDDVQIGLEGSPLFAELDGSVKRFAVSTTSRNATLTVIFGEARGERAIVDFSGEISEGVAGVRIHGTAYGGIVRAELTWHRQTREVAFKLHFDFVHWAQKPVLRIAHFTKLVQIADVLGKGTPIALAFTTGGEEVEIGAGSLDAGSYQTHLRAFLNEIRYLRKLDSFFGLSMLMPEDVDDVLRDTVDADGLLALVEIQESEKQELLMTLVPTDTVNELIEAVESRKPGAVSLQQNLKFRIFGQWYGPFDVVVECSATVVLPVGPANIKEGVPVQLLMRAIDGSRWSARRGDSGAPSG